MSWDIAVLYPEICSAYTSVHSRDSCEQILVLIYTCVFETLSVLQNCIFINHT